MNTADGLRGFRRKIYKRYFILFRLKNADYPQIKLKYIIFSLCLRINDILEMIDIVA
jgi:hypothetical protein